MSDSYDNLKIENQLCFPLYACAKEITKRYKTVLDKVDLTYTQYICMMVLWENNKSNVKEIGKVLFLDSGTLTPVLKKLEAKGYIKRERSKNDERNLSVELTEKGKKLKEKVKNVPEEVGKCVNLSKEEVAILYKTLYKILDTFKDDYEEN